MYGKGFTGLYTTGINKTTGSDDGLEMAKAAWAKELKGFADQMDKIAYALDHLPEKAPNVIEFRNLCRSAPQKELPRLERKFTEEELAANRHKVSEIAKTTFDKPVSKGKIHLCWRKIAENPSAYPYRSAKLAAEVYTEMDEPMPEQLKKYA